MSEIKELLQLPNGQRIEWTGERWVPVRRERDPRASPFRAGVEETVGGLSEGIDQIIAAIAGDRQALEELERSQALRAGEREAADQYGGLGFNLGAAAPYALGAAITGPNLVAGAALDAALGGLSYGDPSERALGAALGAAAPLAGAGLAQGARLGLRRLRAGSAQRVQAGVDAQLGPLPMAGGSAVAETSQANVNLAARLLMRLRGERPDPTYMAQTARARGLADQYGIRLTPAMETGAPGLVRAEASLEAQPWSAAVATREADAFQEAFEREWKEFLLPGHKGAFDQNFVRQLDESLTEGFQDLAKRSRDIQVSADDIIDRAGQLLAGESTGGWVPKHWDHFEKLLENVRKQADESGNLTGEQAWTLQQDFAEQAARDFKRVHEQGVAAQSVADALELSVINASEGRINTRQVDLLRKRYRVRQALERSRAMERGKLYLGRTHSAIRRAFPLEYGRNRGVSDMSNLGQLQRAFDVTEVGNVLFQGRIGDSGTATRLSLSELSPRDIANNTALAMLAELYYGRAPITTAIGLGGTGAAAGVVGSLGE